MTGLRTRLVAGFLCWMMAVCTARAQPTTFTITDGTVDFTLEGIAGQPTTSVGGGGHLRTGIGDAPIDHLAQNWFWFRTTGDTRERALSNLSSLSISENHARLVYLEPSNNGATANALHVELQYTIHDLSNGGDPEALLVIGFVL